MRLAALAIGWAILAPACVHAQPAAIGSTPADDSLSAALFVNRAPALPIEPAIRASAEGFAAPAFVGEGLSGQPTTTGRVAAAGEGLIAWRSNEVSRAAGGGAVDTVRLSVAEISRTPLMTQGVAYDPAAVDVTFSRGWPGAVLMRAGGVGLSVSPHAGFGVGSAGGNSAEAGALFRLSSVKTALQDKLTAMGVKNGATYGGQGRWYLFAAVRGQSVGLNMMSNGGALRQAGWSTDASSALVGDGQVGVGWRKGGMEASFGYVHRGVKVQNAPYGASDSFSESLAAMSLTFHPGW